MAETEKITFEQGMARLEEIVRALDDGGLSLDDSLKLFEEGIRMTRLCGAQLTEAQGRLEILTTSPDGGQEALELELR